MEPTTVQALFCAQASALKKGMQARLGDIAKVWLHDPAGYIDKACRLAYRLGINDAPATARWNLITGNGTWSVHSESLISTNRVFDRINMVMAPTTADVERALRCLEITTSAAATMAVAMTPGAECSTTIAAMAMPARPGDAVAVAAVTVATAATPREEAPVVASAMATAERLGQEALAEAAGSKKAGPVRFSL